MFGAEAYLVVKQGDVHVGCGGSSAAGGCSGCCWMWPLLVDAAAWWMWLLARWRLQQGWVAMAEAIGFSAITLREGTTPMKGLLEVQVGVHLKLRGQRSNETSHKTVWQECESSALACKGEARSIVADMPFAPSVSARPPRKTTKRSNSWRPRRTPRSSAPNASEEEF